MNNNQMKKGRLAKKQTNNKQASKHRVKQTSQEVNKQASKENKQSKQASKQSQTNKPSKPTNLSKSAIAEIVIR